MESLLYSSGKRQGGIAEDEDLDKNKDREKGTVLEKGGDGGGGVEEEDIEEMDVWWKEDTDAQKKRGDVSGHLTLYKDVSGHLTLYRVTKRGSCYENQNITKQRNTSPTRLYNL